MTLPNGKNDEDWIIRRPDLTSLGERLVCVSTTTSRVREGFATPMIAEGIVYSLL